MEIWCHFKNIKMFLYLVFTSDVSTGTSTNTSITALCHVKRKTMQAQAHERKIFDPCAYACIEAVSCILMLASVLASLLKTRL